MERAGKFNEFKAPVFEQKVELKNIKHFARVFDLRRLGMLVKR